MEHDFNNMFYIGPLSKGYVFRGQGHAVAEILFQLLKRERVRRQIYPGRDDARVDVF